MIAAEPAAIVATWSPWVRESEIELASLPMALRKVEREEVELVTAALLVDDDPELDHRVLEARRRAQNIRFAIVLHKSTLEIGRKLGLLQPRAGGGRPRKSAGKGNEGQSQRASGDPEAC